MAESRALQRNAADPKQRHYADKVEKRREQRRMGMYQAALSTSGGRFALADIIVRSGKNKSPWNPHGGVQSANIGRLEVGLELDQFLKLVSLELWRLMWQEWDAVLDRDDREVDAAQTTRTTEAETP